MSIPLAQTVRALRPSPYGKSLARLARRGSGDPHVLLAAGLIVPVLVVQVIVGLGDWGLVGGLSAAFLAVQVALLGARRFIGSTWLDLARLGAGLAYVTAVSRLGPAGGTPPLLALYIPIVAMAAAFGARQAVVVGGWALIGYVAAIALNADASRLGSARAIAVGATAIVVSIGARRTVASLERALVSMRRVMAADRRRDRQLAGVEEVGSLLARAGPTDDALGGVMDLLVERFEYRFVSIYLGDRNRMHLGAQRGYQEPIPEFEANDGVLGRVMRTGAPALVPDVARDADYKAARDEAQSLISVPLLVAGDMIGVINVETVAPEMLDESDLATLRLVGDRLAAALALARERERLARRVHVFERLTVFAQSLTTTLEPQALYERIPPLVSAIVACDALTLTIRDEATGEYRVVAIPGADGRFVGSTILPGEGMTGRAILERQLVIDEFHGRASFPQWVRTARLQDEVAIAAVPLIREDAVIGALALIRYQPTEPFDDLDREVLPLIGSQAALAITNAHLHSAAMEASIRDPLTGLYNRRHLDSSLERMTAARGRLRPDERRPISIVLFDLDHFGQFNKQYGHAVGDEVLRAFARILRKRARASDVLARFGGEEFVAVLDGASRDEAVRFAEEVRSSLASTAIDGPNDEELGATVSAGCAGFDREAGSLAELLVTADVGLRMAKQAGRDRVVAA